MIGMQGCIKTYYGTTELFDIKRSLRQGDPLAPILFTLFMDALHEGIANNPYLPDVNMGYKFKSHKNIINSIGFADDLIIFAECWKHLYITHEWIREFIWTHGGILNKDKTFYTILNVNKSDNYWLYNSDGTDIIQPRNVEENFKYLGLYINMDLTWTKQIQIMENNILKWSNDIKRSGISMMKALEIYKSILLPKLDLGLTHVTIDKGILSNWSKIIIKSLFNLDDISTTLSHGISEFVFTEITGATLITERYWNNKIKELIYNLNSTTYDNITTINRLTMITDIDQRNNLNFYEKNKNLNKNSHKSRFSQIIQYFKSNSIFIQIQIQI